MARVLDSAMLMRCERLGDDWKLLHPVMNNAGFTMTLLC